jgi:hypothetical protein
MGWNHRRVVELEVWEVWKVKGVAWERRNVGEDEEISVGVGL